MNRWLNPLGQLWENLRSSLWFIPAVMVFGAVVLAIGLIETDVFVEREHLVNRWPRLFGGGAEGARGMLSAIASSMITVAGVAFSITIVAFVLASSQYSSRILRNFMRDRANQSVLGVFVGVFAYCLVVLRTIRGGDEGMFVPALAVLVAVLLAFVAIGCLIFFIHHVAASIQAASIIQSAAQETLHAIDRLFPSELGEAALDSEAPAPDLNGRTWMTVSSRATGYIQGIDADALLAVARDQNAILRMERGIGEFVIEAAPLASLSGQAFDEATAKRINAAYTLGRHRTIQQDAGYGIRQIVDVALKALSPGINDTTTAIICIDFLGAILARLAARQVETPFRSDGAELRIITRGATFAGLLAESFDQIRHCAGGNVAVLARMLEVLEVIAGRTADAPRCRAIGQQANLITDTAEVSIRSAYDREIVKAAEQRLLMNLSKCQEVPR